MGLNQDGVVLDILIQVRRDATVAKRFIKRLLAGSHCAPRMIVTPSVTATFCRMSPAESLQRSAFPGDCGMKIEGNHINLAF